MARNKNMALTVSQLKEQLEMLEEDGHGDKELRFVYQQNYPLQDKVRTTWVQEDDKGVVEVLKSRIVHAHRAYKTESVEKDEKDVLVWLRNRVDSIIEDFDDCDGLSMDTDKIEEAITENKPEIMNIKFEAGNEANFVYIVSGGQDCDMPYGPRASFNA